MLLQRKLNKYTDIDTYTIYLWAFMASYRDSFTFKKWSRYSDWLRAGRPRGWSSSPGRVKNFLFSTGYGAHPGSYPVGTGGKAAEA
jgi:hypothetical protein